MVDVKLYVLHGRQAGAMIPITGSRFFIGRAEDCHLRPHSDLISRHHCGITIQGESVLIRDFGSKNGTFVNGRRIEEEVELHAGDRMQVGSLEFEIRITTPESVEEPAPPAVPEPVAEAPGSDSAIYPGVAPSDGSSASFAAIPGMIPPPAGYPGYAPPAGYASPGYPPPGYAPQGYPPQGYAPQGYAPPGYAPQGYPPQGYAPPGYPSAGYAPQGYPPQGYAPPQGYPPQGYPAGGVPAQPSPMPQGGIPPLGQASRGWLDDDGEHVSGSGSGDSGFYSNEESAPDGGSTVILTAEELARRQAERAEKLAQSQARKDREAEQGRKKSENAALDSLRQSQASGQTMADEALRNMLRPF